MKILGIDLGVASVGWALVDIDRQEITDSGVRIFTQSADRHGKTFAAVRREARLGRRVLSRKQQRLNQIRRVFLEHNLLDKEDIKMLHQKKQRKDVWQLRDKGLKRQLTAEEWARILIHIAKRRGYQSNRKAEEIKNPDSKKVLGAIGTNEKNMKEGKYLTIGAMIYDKTKSRKSGEKIRRNKKDSYTFSVSRGLLIQEIDQLFNRQKQLGNPHTSEQLQKAYTEIAFYQRPLRFDENMIGKCTFEQGENRGPKNSFSMEKAALLGKITNTNLVDPETGEIFRLFDYQNLNVLMDVFYRTTEVKYATLKKALGIPEQHRFEKIDYNPDYEKSTKINTDINKFFERENWFSTEQKKKVKTHVWDEKKGKLKSYSYWHIKSILSIPEDQKFEGVNYDKHPEDEKFGTLAGYRKIKSKLDAAVFEKVFDDREKFNRIAVILSYQKDDVELRKSFREEIFDGLGFDENVITQNIEGLLDISFSGFHSLSIKAADKLLPLLEKGIKYHEAAKTVYGHHSQIYSGNTKQRLLRILNKQESLQLTNPAVKRTFSQFRKVVNAVIQKYGCFDAMHIEIVRELKNSKKTRVEIATGQKKYREEKQTQIEHFKECFAGAEPTGKQLLKFMLYQQQHSKSIYSGESIDIYRLIDDGYVDIDHILPKSRTFDDSLNNKVLCLKSENAQKGNQTPFEWMANSDKNSDKWQWFGDYINSIHGIKIAKKHKLLNTTLPVRRGNELTEDDIENPESGFLARNLNDTAYAAKFIKNFVESNLEFLKNDKIKQKVKVRQGAITDQLRYSWGLDPKDRTKNLHHAEDAIILAFATQREVQRMSTLSAKREEFKHTSAEHRDVKFKPPFPGFRDSVREGCEKIFVSFAPRRKISGAAHKDTIAKQGGKKDDRKFKVNHGVAEKGEIKRVDVFINDQGRYKFIPFYPHHFYQEKLPTQDLSGSELSDGYEFMFSLFKDELIEFKRKKDKKSHIVYFKFVKSDGRIAYQQHSESKIEGTLLATGGGLEMLRKYQITILGTCHQVNSEKRLPLIKQMRRMKKKCA